MKGAELLVDLRDAETALWWAIRDGLFVTPEQLGRLRTPLEVSLATIEDHIETLRTLLEPLQRSLTEQGS